MSNYNNSLNVDKVYEIERKYLYGIKTIDEDGCRCITACKSKEMALKIDKYLNKHKTLLFDIADNEEEMNLINSEDYCILMDLTSFLDIYNYVTVAKHQFDGRIEQFKDYFIDNGLGNQVAEIEVMNKDYIKDVIID